jgi:flavin-dependent dehydrogenase
VPVGLGPRRGALDKLLVDAAVEAGAELREGFAVDELSFDEGRVTGVRGRARDGGGTVAEAARFVIGADGRNSQVAKRVQAAETHAAPTITCWYFSYWSGVPGEALELIRVDGRVIFAFPTNDSLFAVFVSWPIEELATVRAEPATQLPNFMRTPGGPGWALVGDAGCHKDPYMALGVCDAFRDAELLSEAVADVLSGRVAEAEALTGYERRRNEATLPDYHANMAMASSAPLPPELLERRAAARGDQEAANRFYMVAEGLVAP